MCQNISSIRRDLRKNGHVRDSIVRQKVPRYILPVTLKRGYPLSTKLCTGRRSSNHEHRKRSVQKSWTSSDALDIHILFDQFSPIAFVTILRDLDRYRPRDRALHTYTTCSYEIILQIVSKRAYLSHLELGPNGLRHVTIVTISDAVSSDGHGAAGLTSNASSRMKIRPHVVPPY